MSVPQFTCDISNNGLTLSSTTYTCPPAGAEYLPSNAVIAVTGSGKPISIDAVPGVQLSFSGVSITTAIPITIKNSVVRLEITSGSTLTATDGPAISCEQNSNITFSGSHTSTFTVTGSENNPAIGARSGETCGLIDIRSSITATGSPAIGAGRSQGSSQFTYVDAIEIHSGTITATSTTAAAIGAGEASSDGVSKVGRINVTSGTLRVFATGGHGAGIGTSYVSGGASQSVVNTIQVRGGDITIESEGGAGIGTGYVVGGKSTIDRIDVDSSGTLTIKSARGAGIGSGQVAGGQGQVSTIAVLSGRVTIDSEQAAAIGSGSAGGAGNSMVNHVQIDHGTFRLVGTGGGAGIGSGPSGVGSSEVQTVLIRGGEIYAEGNDAAGIGSGAIANLNAFSNVETITIQGGTVTARGVRGAGIGAGPCASGSSTVGAIRIVGGTIDATGQDAPGIGSGEGAGTATGDVVGSAVGAIELSGGTFTIAGGGEAPGLGSGPATQSGKSTVNSIVVRSGVLGIAGSPFAPAIGPGHPAASSATSSVTSVTLAGGFLTLSGYIGIGANAPGTLGTLYFGEPTGTVTFHCQPGSTVCIQANAIQGQSARLVGLTESPVFIDPSWDPARTNLDGLDFYGQYEGDSAPDGFGNKVMLHVREVSPVNSEIVNLMFLGPTLNKTEEFWPKANMGFIVSLPEAGKYRVVWSSIVDEDWGTLSIRGSSEFGVAPEGESYVEARADMVIPSPQSTSGSARAAIIGGAVGGIVVLAIIVAIVVWRLTRFMLPEGDQRAEPMLDEDGGDAPDGSLSSLPEP